MEYNTQRGKMIIPEYGRNVQNMIIFAMSVHEREVRNLVARSIVKVMSQLHPNSKEVTDYKHKLWDQMIIMSDFKLEVDSPYPFPDKEVLFEKPKRMNYPNKVIKNKHYGAVIEGLVEKAVVIFEPKEKAALTISIANMMKKAYISWNKDSVSDRIILEHLNQISTGRLTLPSDTKLEVIVTNTAPVNKNNQARGGQQKKSNNFHQKKSGFFGKSNNNKRRFK